MSTDDQEDFSNVADLYCQTTQHGQADGAKLSSL